MPDPNYPPLNEGEQNFLRLNSLTLIRYHQWKIVVHMPLRIGSINLILDRERGFDEWFKLVRLHSLSQVP